MRLVLPLAFVCAAASTATPADPPKVDLKKGVEFTGHAEAIIVEVRPRVTGTLDNILVKDGEHVRKGDVIAEVDDRQYKLEVSRAKAQLVQAQAEVKIAAAEMARVKQAL